MLAAVPPEPRVPAWMAVVIACPRARGDRAARHRVAAAASSCAAEELGKYKMIFQMFALEALLVHYTWPIPGTGLSVDFHAAGMRFLWVALVLAVWSGVDYYVRVFRRLDLE